jgi:hypothetical protein
MISDVIMDVYLTHRRLALIVRVGWRDEIEVATLGDILLAFLPPDLNLLLLTPATEIILL